MCRKAGSEVSFDWQIKPITKSLFSSAMATVAAITKEENNFSGYSVTRHTLNKSNL